MDQKTVDLFGVNFFEHGIMHQRCNCVFLACLVGFAPLEDLRNGPATSNFQMKILRTVATKPAVGLVEPLHKSQGLQTVVGSEMNMMTLIDLIVLLIRPYQGGTFPKGERSELAWGIMMVVRMYNKHIEANTFFKPNVWRNHDSRMIPAASLSDAKNLGLWPTNHFVASCFVARNWQWTSWQCPLCSWWCWCQPCQTRLVLSAVWGEKDIRTYVHKKRAWAVWRMSPFFGKMSCGFSVFYFHPNLGKQKFPVLRILFLHSLSTSFFWFIWKLWEKFQPKGVKRIVEELREKFVMFWGETRQKVHPSGMFVHQKYAPTTCNAFFGGPSKETGTNQPSRDSTKRWPSMGSFSKVKSF